MTAAQAVNLFAAAYLLFIGSAVNIKGSSFTPVFVYKIIPITTALAVAFYTLK